MNDPLVASQEAVKLLPDSWPWPYPCDLYRIEGALLSIRADHRTASQMRPVTIETGWSAHAEGSAIVSFGDTKVLCTASFTEGVPRGSRAKIAGGHGRIRHATAGDR